MSEGVKVNSKKPEVKKENRVGQGRKTEKPQSTNSPADQILQLQRTVGNQAVQRLIKSGTLQAKLKIGQPNDIYEQEADRVAEQVMSMPKPQVVSSGTLSIQETCPRCKEEKLRRQTIKEEGEEEELLQTKEISGQNSETTPNLESRINAIRSGGRPLSESERSFYEPRFGYDFSQVRVHTGTRAAESAQMVKARAFTVGKNIFFGAGEYVPNGTRGQRLLAHELTHVKQQSEKRLSGTLVSRVPDKSGIRDRRYSYSTHCGWIDWGHTNPGLSRNLIAIVREASMRVARRETARATQAALLRRRVSAETPVPINESRCIWAYEKNEVADSAHEQPVTTTQQFSSGLVEVRLGGFGVDSDDSAKFIPFVSALPPIIQGWSALQNRQFKAIFTGYTDCIGIEARNQTLRRRRSASIASRLATTMASVQGGGRIQMEFKFAPVNQYLASNASRQGRRINRGVRLQLVPQVSPIGSERMILPQMRSGKFGIVFSGVTPTIGLKRSLSEAEVLRVSLGIFMIQSLVFEALQSWTDLIAHSSFSEEDLPSNLIGFYRASQGYSSAEVRQICNVWNVARSLKAFRGYSFQRNYNFQPPRLPAGGTWPNQFNSITPAAPGSPLYDIIEILLETPLITRRCRLVGGYLRCS